MSDCLTLLPPEKEEEGPGAASDPAESLAGSAFSHDFLFSGRGQMVLWMLSQEPDWGPSRIPVCPPPASSAAPKKELRNMSPIQQAGC